MYVQSEICKGILNTMRVSSADKVSSNTQISDPNHGIYRNWVKKRLHHDSIPDGLFRKPQNQNRSNSKNERSSTF